MKNLILISTLISIVSYTTNAQITKGSFSIGGGFDYSSTKPENDNAAKYSSFSFSPSAGYFVIDKLAVGLNVGVGAGKNTYPTYSVKTNSVSIGPYVRYYIPTSNDKFAFYGQASFAIASGSSKPSNAGKTKTANITVGISPGFAYFFNEHWSAELGFYGIRYESQDPDTNASNDKINSLDFSFNSLSPSSIGIRYYFK